MDIQKPIPTQEYDETEATLEAELGACRRKSVKRARIGFVGIIGLYLGLYATFDIWGTWVLESGGLASIQGAGLQLVVAAPVIFVLCWATSTGEVSLHKKLVEHRLAHGNLLEDEIEALSEIIRQHPEIKAVVKAWSAEGLQVRASQYKALRKYAADLRTIDVKRALEEAIED